MFVVYAIKSQKRNYIYVGMINNLQRRLRQHCLGKSSTTKAYCPFDLIYSEELNTRPEARKREKFLKSGIGREFLREKFCASGGMVDTHV